MFKIDFNTILESQTELIIHIANKGDLYMSPITGDECIDNISISAIIVTPTKSQRKVCFYSYKTLTQFGVDIKKTTIPKGKSEIDISIQNIPKNIKWKDISLNLKISKYKPDVLYWIMVAGFYFILPFSILGLFIWFWYKSFVL